MYLFVCCLLVLNSVFEGAGSGAREARNELRAQWAASGSPLLSFTIM